MKQRSDYIGILDGIRAYSILIVAGFHLWQQSWLQNLFPSNLLQFMGVRNFSLNWVPRTGYMFVDVMLLLSGFCLFLPYARQMTDPLAPEPDNLRTFFKKRAARILPSYYLCLLLYLIFWVRPSDYANIKQYLQDIFAHLTFTQTFWPESYIGTKFPTALWTLGVEMQSISSSLCSRACSVAFLLCVGRCFPFWRRCISCFLHICRKATQKACASTSSRHFWVYMQTVCCVRSSSAACGYGASANGRKTVFYRLRR